MAEIDNGDVLRIAAVMAFESVYQVVNVYHARVTAGGGVTYAVGGMDVQEYMQGIYDGLKVQLSNTMASDYISLANVTQTTTFGAMGWTTPWTGNESGEVGVPGVCLFAFARTLKPRVQIRKYYGVFGEVNLVSGQFSSAARAAAQVALTAHIQSFVSSGALTLMGTAYNRTLGTYVDAISATTSLEPAYQRRRRRGRGS